MEKILQNLTHPKISSKRSESVVKTVIKKLSIRYTNEQTKDMYITYGLTQYKMLYANKVFIFF